MRQQDANLFPPYGLEDLQEFFRKGDDGDYAYGEPHATEDPLLAEVRGRLDWAQIELQLERRARNARWVTGLMVALSLGTVLAFAVRSTDWEDSQGGHTSAESAPRLLRPDESERSRTRSHIASMPRIESAKGGPDSAEQDAAVARSELDESRQTLAPGRAQSAPPGGPPVPFGATGPSNRMSGAPLTFPASSRHVRAAIRSSQADRSSRAPAVPPKASSTPARNPQVQPGGRPPNAAPSARSYRPPTARFED